VWAIVQFSWTGYNPRYWHVWIVMEVYSDYIIVSDMNYRRINEVTYRKVSISDRSINGYIYVD
jgi:surface antigen